MSKPYGDQPAYTGGLDIGDGQQRIAKQAGQHEGLAPQAVGKPPHHRVEKAAGKVEGRDDDPQLGTAGPQLNRV